MDKLAWGTWEELLLACAVHRYGTDSWESVALEVQKRSLSFTALTGFSCKHKYYDLKRRFRHCGAVLRTDHNDNDDSSCNNNNNNNIPWLEELRQLRVAELRREVERYDDSIVSLQLKVKRLKEEREKSLGEEEKEKERSDLEKPTGEVEKGGSGGTEKVSGEDSDRENQSVNESNETDPKVESPAIRGGIEEVKMQEEKAAGHGGVKEASCNSVAETKGGDGGESGGGRRGGKESSEVQSSACLARKEDEKIEDAEDERGNEEGGSPAIKSVDVESQPLVDFLEILRSRKHSSFFQRRFDAQETTHLYTKLIRQHIDLETIRSRVDEGWYSGCKKKFFRDLLLLFNNAIFFFNKQSPESLAAVELRRLVLKEMGVKVALRDPLAGEKQLELHDQVPVNSVEVKPKMRPLMVACRKRSSIPTKASSSLFSVGTNKGERKLNPLEVEPFEDVKSQIESKNKAEKTCDTKKRTRDRFTASARSTNNSKARNSARTNKDSDGNSKASWSSKAASQSVNVESKNQKEIRSTTNSSSRKKGAANFLNRMKRGFPVSNVPLLESLRQPAIGSDHSKAAGQKGSSNSKSDARKNQNHRKGSGGKQETQQVSTVKKGRPPKRAAAPPPPPSPIATAKRSREAGGTEAGSSAPGKKRSKR